MKILLTLFFISFSVFALEPCELQAQQIAKLVANQSISTIVQKPVLIWFSESVSYEFKIKNPSFSKIQFYKIKYSLIGNDDFGLPKKCHLINLCKQNNQNLTGDC